MVVEHLSFDELGTWTTAGTRCFSGHPKDYCRTGRLDPCFWSTITPLVSSPCVYALVDRRNVLPESQIGGVVKFPSLDRSRTGLNWISFVVRTRVSTGTPSELGWRRNIDFLDWNRISTFSNIPPACCVEPSVSTVPNLLFCPYRTIYV